ncbi:MAG: hypothetical protein AUJ75_00110 [Candidatus Omnitrophica bacterium CG1_02_49_10]|nr:MAG: hypothetical protein AUJ75_00110 [Candidatus Omnitrophica bacterium CG1_02_49_10]
MAQINPTVGDIEANKRKILWFMGKAAREGAGLVIFPELAVTGYPPEDLLLKPHFVSDNIRAIKSIASNAPIPAVIGFVDRDKNGGIYNAAAFIQNKRIKGTYHKMRLPNYGVFDEKRYFKEGRSPFIFRLGGTSIGVTICEDIWEDGIAALLKKKGAKAIINISSSPYHMGKSLLRENLVRKQAKRLGAWFFYNNIVGGQDELVFDGGSMIFDKRGKLIARAAQFTEELIVTDLPDEPYHIPPIKVKRPGRLEEVYNALVLGTGDYVRKAGFSKAVIGLSGGIDSSLVAAIARDALGNENVIGVSMPSEYTSKASLEDAKILADRLKIKLIKIPITNVYASYLKALKAQFARTKRGLAEENLQARIRGALLMALSNKFGYLVLTTGNKSETAVGYCTLYGDMAGGFAVLKDVPKTMVYELSRFRNSKGAAIPRRVLTKAPTAELRRGQKDSDSIPPYPRLDPIIKGYVEEDKSLDDLIKRGYDRRTLKKVIRLIDMSEYKRRQAPPGIKITPKAFGKDRRLPIINGYRASK